MARLLVSFRAPGQHESFEMLKLFIGEAKVRADPFQYVTLGGMQPVIRIGRLDGVLDLMIAGNVDRVGRIKHCDDF